MKRKVLNLRPLTAIAALLLTLSIPMTNVNASNSPLCFTAKNGAVTVRFEIKNVTHTIQYSTDSVNWNTYSSNTNINLNANGKVYFRAATNQTTATAFGNRSYSYSSHFYFTTSNNGKVEASGNIMSLYGPDCPNLPLQQYAFANIFYYCDLLTTVPDLPATTLADYCYSFMFSSCTSLTSAPSLPATSLVDYCYSQMFNNCTSLTSIPALPATNLDTGCYFYMFSSCTSLTSTPSLPATTLADSCYYGMFNRCTSLTSAPSLPATTLADYCYSYMFANCTSLTSAPSLPATSLANYCYNKIFYGCSSLKVNTSAPGVVWSIPYGATAETNWNYQMFYKTGGPFTGNPTIGLTYYIESALPKPLCFTARYGSVTVTFDIKNVSHTIQYSTNNSTWQTYTSNTPINLNANGKVYFRAENIQTTAPAFGANQQSNSSRFYFTTSNGGTVNASGDIMSLYNSYNLPLQPYAFANMFYDCTLLTSIPELSATSLADHCYENMFYGCSSLKVNTSIPGPTWSIPSDATTATDWNANMFTGTSGSLSANPTIGTTYYIGSALPKPLCFTARNGSVTVTFDIRNVTHTIIYSTDDTYWYTYTSKTPINLNTNESVYFSALNNASTATAFGCDSYCSNSSRFTFTSSNGGTVEASGNIMSLYGPDCPNLHLQSYAFAYLFNGCSLLTTPPELPATSLEMYCYFYMFAGCTSLTSAPALPATFIYPGSYYHMFDGCTSLTLAPALPGTTLRKECYYYMFAGCTSLTSAPALPVTSLENYCYAHMFDGCTSLTSAPALPATTLRNNCYESMFSGCSSLTSIPALHATTLQSECYKSMFKGCTSLTSTPTLPATTLADGCYASMFSGCTSLTSAPALPVTTLAGSCYESMFSGCTSLTSAPTLPATTLAGGCYKSMFSGCTSLTSAPVLPATTLSSYCYKSMFSGCTSLTSAPALPATILFDCCYEYMFAGCTSLTSAPALPATYIPYASYRYMFQACTSLTTAPLLPASNVSESGYADMFLNCTSLTTAPALPATHLSDYCYMEMFWNCTSLTTAPAELPATTLHDLCYSMMFAECTSLTSAPALPATTLAYGCYTMMFFDCTSLTSAPALPATNLAERCYWGMFSNCSTLTSIPELPATTLTKGCYGSMFRRCVSLRVNTTTPGVAWSIPSGATAATDWNLYMFENTGGTFFGDPAIGTTYYIAPQPPAPLCFTARNGSVTVRLDLGEVSFSIRYSTDNINWNDYNTTINLNADEKVYLRASFNQTTAKAFGDLQISNSSRFYFTSSNGGTIEASGNIMSLYGPDCPKLPLQPYAFAHMFDSCALLTKAPVLPDSALSNHCYYGMFEGCTSLISAPDLPATTLAECCYSCMFMGCTSLTSAPDLPATTLAEYCYSTMFNGCTSLTSAPELPATTLADYCYYSMFKGCTSLTTTPELPATNLAQFCYSYMFNGCTSLTSAPELPATTLAEYCYSTMFKGCTSLTSIPELPATDLSQYCYNEMFKGCSSLKINTNAPGKQWEITSSSFEVWYNRTKYMNDMFTNTSGTMNGMPSINTTYYIASGKSKTATEDGSWNDASIWPNGKIPGDADTVTINNDITIPAGANAYCYSVTLGNGGTLTVAPNATLHATTITNTDPTKFIIQADSASTGTVRFTSGSPKVTMQMCFIGTFDEEGDTLYPEWQYRGFVGTPDPNQSLQNIAVFKWNETKNNVGSWDSIYNGYSNTATGTFYPWDGYSMANFGAANAIKSYTTTLLPTNQTKTYYLTKTTTGNGNSDALNCGVNLLTNSYSAPINMSAGITSSNIESTFYFFNTRTKSEFEDDKNAAITTYPSASGGYLQAASPYIPAGQSFAVKATADGATLTIPASAVSTVSSGAMYAPKQTAKFGMVKIVAEGDNAIDDLYLLQSDSCTADFDNGYDGTKMFSSKADQIYALNEFGKTAVNADNSLLGQYIGFKPLSNGSSDITLSISSRDLEGYYELYLYDYQTDTYIEISDDETSYTFTATGEETPRRFQIVGKAADGTQYYPNQQPRIEVVAGEIYLMNFDRTDTPVILSDAAGRTLWSINAKDGTTFSLPNLPPGLYIVSCGKVSTKYVH